MKAALRTRLHAQRNALSAVDRARFSDLITDRIVALDAYRRARVVMAYMTFGSEFLTERFVHHVLRDNKVLVLPKVRRTDQRLSLHVVRDFDTDLLAGPWGIREPHPERCSVTAVADIDFILVPGLGFSASGARLGYGRGYYDRLLQRRSPHTALVSAAYEVQLVDHIPVEPHDIPIEVIVTERGIHGVNGGMLSQATDANIARDRQNE